MKIVCYRGLQTQSNYFDGQETGNFYLFWCTNKFQLKALFLFKDVLGITLKKPSRVY